MRMSAIAVLITGVLSGTVAVAEDANTGGLYVSFDVGSTKYDARATDYDRRAENFAGDGATVLESRMDQRESGWGLAVWGLQDKHRGIEVSRLKTGVMSHDALVSVNGAAGPATLPVVTAVRSRGWAVSSVGIVPLSSSLQLEGRAGAYFGKARTTMSYPAEQTGNVRQSRSDSSTSLLLGGGIVYSPPKSPFGLTAGYTFLSSVAGKPLHRVSFGVRLWIERGPR